MSYRTFPLAFVAFALAACAVPTASEAPAEHRGEIAQAMYNDGHGRSNACSASQIEGGYEDVDGTCLLTCWNCPGDIGGGSGSVPGGCTSATCGDPGGGGGGGGGSTGSGGGTTTSPQGCNAAHTRCYDGCPPSPVLPEGDTNPGHLAAYRNAERCYARCDAAYDRCGG